MIGQTLQQKLSNSSAFWGGMRYGRVTKKLCWGSIKSIFRERFSGYIFTASDVSRLEQEIDQLVYQLYGLSEVEIRIIKGESNHAR